MDVQDAIERAKALVGVAFSDEDVGPVRTEEVEFDRERNARLVTLGLMCPAIDTRAGQVASLLGTAMMKRSYEVFVFTAGSGGRGCRQDQAIRRVKDRTLLVDTQLLVFLTIGMTKVSLIARHRRTEDICTKTDFEFLLDVIGYGPRFLFCPHVAAEVSNIVAQHGEPDRTALLSVFKGLLRNATEAQVPSVEATEQPEYTALGLADAAQLALCIPDAVLLTDEEPLFRAASFRGTRSFSAAAS